MDPRLITFLNSCNECYSNGEVYVPSDADVQLILETTAIDIQNKCISDSIYDSIYYKLKELYSTDPFFSKLTSINTGYGVDVKLPIPAGSLTECKLNDLERWVIKKDKYTITEKLDGCSIILYYSEGHLQQAITRGNGTTGKDCTRHIVDLDSIPLELEQDKKFTGYIRGELICPIYDIKAMLDDLSRETGRVYKNGRNTIAGYLNSKETLQAVKKHVQVVTYNIMGSNKKHSEQLSWLNNNGFLIVANEIVDGKDITDPSMIDKLNQYRRVSRYEIDGIVITRETEENISYETGTINPTSARKFKMVSMLGISSIPQKTTVIGITWNPSKNMKLKPILQVEPIEIDGSVVSNVTGNNLQWLQERQIGIGSDITIIKSGDVIPKIIDILSTSTNLNLPTNCHQEGVDLVLDSSNEEVLLQQLLHFCKTLEVDFAGEGNLQRILDVSNISKPIDLLYISRETMVDVIGVNGGKLYDSLLSKINNISRSKLADATGCFGEGFGERILKTVEEKYHDLVAITERLDGFGDIRTAEYNKHIADWKKIEEIYIQSGYKFLSISPTVSTETIVVPTGFRFKPEEVERLNKAGYTVADSITKATNILVVKDINSGSSKVKKARDMGITIIEKDMFTF